MAIRALPRQKARRHNSQNQFLGRLEFQDGKRKEATQAYHGRGAESIQYAQLERKFAATVSPKGHPLRGMVLDGQPGRGGSGWPVMDGVNCYDPAVNKVKLHHSKADKDLGIRGYCPELMAVLKCHQDTQLEPGTGLMLKYVATYLPKFSDGPGKELMDDHSTGYAAARRVLVTYHPGEPEMWLLLGNQQQPMFFMCGTMQPIIAPHPGMEPKPRYVELYENATWKLRQHDLVGFFAEDQHEGPHFGTHPESLQEGAADYVAGSVREELSHLRGKNHCGRDGVHVE